MISLRKKGWTKEAPTPCEVSPTATAGSPTALDRQIPVGASGKLRGKHVHALPPAPYASRSRRAGEPRASAKWLRNRGASIRLLGRPGAYAFRMIVTPPARGAFLTITRGKASSSGTPRSRFSGLAPFLTRSIRLIEAGVDRSSPVPTETMHAQDRKRDLTRQKATVAERERGRRTPRRACRIV